MGRSQDPGWWTMARGSTKTARRPPSPSLRGRESRPPRALRRPLAIRRKTTPRLIPTGVLVTDEDGRFALKTLSERFMESRGEPLVVDGRVVQGMFRAP